MSRLKLKYLIKVSVVFFISLRFSFLPHELFKDRANYLFRIYNSELYFSELFSGESFILFSEPLFKVLNYVLSVFFEGEVVLSFYVFINSFLMIYFVMFNRKSLVLSLMSLMILLVSPYFYGGALGAVRQGLGLNLILIFLMRNKSILSNEFIFILLLASLFHVVFFFLFFIFVFYKFLRFFNVKDFFSYLNIFLVVLVFGLTWYSFTPYLSDKHSYEGFETNTSGVTFAAWFCIFILYCYGYFKCSKKNKDLNWDLFFLSAVMFLVFFVFYWFFPGPYRILYSAMPIIISSIMSSGNVYNTICYFLIFLYSSLLLFMGVGAGSMNVEFTEFIFVFLGLH